MPKFFNLDALIPETVMVNLTMADGTTKQFTLRDDFPDEIGFGIIRLIQQLGELRQGGAANSAESIIAQLQLLQGDGTHLLGEIFRHSDPSVTDADLTVIKPYDRMGLLTAFFTSLMTRFKGLQPSTVATAPAAETETAAPETSSPAETPSPNASSPEAPEASETTPETSQSQS